MARAERRKQADIVWLRVIEEDSYYKECAQRFEITEFSDIYEMISELILAIEARVVVIDSAVVFDVYNSAILPLAKSGIVKNIIMYSLRPVFSYFKPNGKTPSVKFVSSPSELCELLNKIFSNSEAKDVSHESLDNLNNENELDKSTEERITKKNNLQHSQNAEVESASQVDFVRAELTEDELQALLGPDYLLDINLDETDEKGNEKK